MMQFCITSLCLEALKHHPQFSPSDSWLLARPSKRGNRSSDYFTILYIIIDYSLRCLVVQLFILRVAKSDQILEKKFTDKAHQKGVKIFGKQF